MKFRHLLFLQFFTLFLLNLNRLSAQCNSVPAGLTCEEAPVLCDLNDLDGYCTTLPDFPNPTGPNPLCSNGGVSNNTIWFGFIAGTTNYNLNIIPANCTNVGGFQGIQGGIYGGDCGSVTQVVCQGQCSTGIINLNGNNFVPGEVYWFIIDGCQGSVCDITVDILAGGPLVMGNINPIVGPKKVCLGGTFNYSTNNVNGATAYHWTLDGNLLGDPENEDNTTSVTFGDAGVHQLCVDVSNYCNDVGTPPVQQCIDVTVTEVIGIDPPEKFVCPNDQYVYNGVPYGPGQYDVTLQSWQKCDSVVTLTVSEIIVPPKDLGIFYKCQGQCITITDKKGNGGIFCDNVEGEEVILESWQGCDSIVNFTLRLVEVDAKIDPPFELGCVVDQTPLDGSGSIIENYQTIDYKWTMCPTCSIIGPDDQPKVDTETPGKYCLTITATAPNGVQCKDSACVVVKFNPFSPVAGIIGDTLSCIKDTITLQGTSNTPNVIYNWKGPKNETYTGQNIKVTNAGNYTLTITAPNQCSNSKTFNVVSNIKYPNADATGGTISCDFPNIDLSGKSDTMGVSYAWYNDQNVKISSVQTVNVNTAGNYIFEVLNPNNGCITYDTVTVSPDFVAPQNISATGDTFDCIKFPVKVDANSSTTGITYAWTGPNGFSSTLKNPDAPYKGDYSVIFTGPNGCKDTAMATVASDTMKPIVTTINDTIECFTFTATLAANSSAANTSYSWSGPGATGSNPTLVVNQAGTYSVTVTDNSNGCKSVATAKSLDASAKPVALAQIPPPLTCDSLTITLIGGSTLVIPSITYQWTGPAGFTANTKNAIVNQPGTYNLLVTNTDNNCSDNISVDVSQDILAPNITATNDTTDCVSGQATLCGNSTTLNAVYQWYNSTNVKLCNTACCDVSGAGDYTLIVTNPVNGCTSSFDVKAVKDDNTPDLTLNKSDDLDCIVLSVDLDAFSSVAGVTYKWSGPGAPGGSVTNFSTTAPGLFSVTVTNPLNKCTNSATINVLQDIQKPVISAITDTIKCSNNKTVLVDGTSDVNSNVTIQWLDENSNPVSSVLDFMTSTSQNYLLTVTNNINGCSKTLTLFVPENTTPPNVSATGDVITCFEPQAICPGNSTTSNVSYSWSGPGNYSASTKDAGGITLDGNYQLIVTDKINGCTSSTSVVVTKDNTDPDVSATGGTLTCTNNSQITLVSNSTTSPVSYSWSGPNNFSSIQQNPIAPDPGAYTVTVTNTQNGCKSTKTVDVLSDETPPNLSVNDATLDCIQKTQILTATSSTPGVTFLWTGPNTNSTNTSVTIADPGQYTCVATAPNGCTISKVATVNLNANLPTVLASVGGELNCTNKNVDVSSTGSSTGTNYVYSWTGPNGFTSNQNNISATEPGSYTLMITNTLNGCSEDITVVVPININVPTAITSSDKNPNCFGSLDGSINVLNVTGGTQPFLYSINGKPFSTASQFSFLGDGTYNISIQDAAGCEYDTLITLKQPLKLTVDAGKDTIIPWGTNYQLEAVIQPSNAKIASITWNPVADTFCSNCLNPIIAPFDASLYTITVVDSNGCKASDKILVLVKKERPIFIPNTFSPNGDGLNDIFYINARDGFVDEITYFQIYDRWGNKIFEKERFLPNDPAYGWDGVYRNKKVNSAVFVYWALIKFKDGESILYKGDVTVQR